MNQTQPIVTLEPTKNGKRPRLAKRALVQAINTKTAKRTASRKLTHRQRVATAIGLVATAVLALSLWHCTEALSVLTGTHLALAALLAIGIDAGLVACELGTIVGDGDGRIWAQTYVYLAVLLSIGLNAYGTAIHAPQGLAWFASLAGGVIPVLIYLGFRAAGHLWRDKPLAVAS